MKLASLLSRFPSVGRLTAKGFLWAAAGPVAGFLLLYSFIIHVRLSLGRWPAFGEDLPAGSLRFHETVALRALAVLFCSLLPATIAFVVCACVRRWRFVAWYLTGYGMATGLALGSFLLAPAPFLDWFLD